MLKVALDISPVSNPEHSIRGVGSYIHNLISHFENNKNVSLLQVNGFKEAFEADILHIPFFDPFQLTLPRSKNHRLVVTIHDLIPLRFPKHFPPGIKGRGKWQIQKHLLKKVDAIITDSEASKKDILHFANVNASKVHVVYLAADQINLNKKSSIKEKYSLPEKFCLYVGDATWNKNLPNIIKASTIANVPLVIVGGAIKRDVLDTKNIWNKDLFEAQEEIKRNQNCLTPGFVTSEELTEFYHLATVLLAPSRYEGFGLPVLEAMQSGCPVITTKNGSLEEVSANAAFFVNDTAESISKGIEKVFNNKSLQKNLAEKGLKNSKRFTWSKTIEDTAKVYQST